MSKKYFSVLVLAIGLLSAGAIVASAQTPANISYPIAELGNCQDKQACRDYCNQLANVSACVDFAKKQGMISEDQAQSAKKYGNIIKNGGPGGCEDEKSCRNYCSDMSHLEECLIFAEKNGLASVDELKEMKQIAQALKTGMKMPGFCSDKESCRQYCDRSENIEECLTFGETAGFISKEEVQEAKKVMSFLKKGKTPGACKSKAECDNYCAKDENFSECVDFAGKAGLISKEELELAKKTGGKGPNGCGSKEACDQYCNQPDNQDACFEFAQKHSLIPEEKLKEIKEGTIKLKAGLEQMPEEALKCLKEKFGEDIVDKIKDGNFTPNQKMGEGMKDCFQKFAKEMNEKFDEIPAEAKACLEKEYGVDFVEKMKSGQMTPPANFQGKVQSCMSSGINGKILGQMPPEMAECVKEILEKEKIDMSDQSKIEGILKSKVQECVQKMLPKDVPQVVDNKNRLPTNSGVLDAMEQAKDCLISIYGEEIVKRVMETRAVPPADFTKNVGACIQKKMMGQ